MANPNPTPSNVHSSLDGLHYQAIDVDIDTGTELTIYNLRAAKQRLIAVVPYTTMTGQRANLIITQDLEAEPVPLPGTTAG